ncbi:MAG TPA: YciI family protein [Candidatus Tumulicola sp.]
MPCFVVIRERGPGWDWSLPMRRQAEWGAHAAFMDARTDDGFIVAGGPLGGENDAARVLHVVAAPDEDAVDARLADDPWTATRLLITVSIEPWTVLLGGLR